jgi:DNA mismatch repair ATPase MutS
LDKWRQRHRAEVRRWFDCLAEFEAIGCLATLAHDRPSFSYPAFTQQGPRFAAQQLAHPLLDRAVPNDLELSGPGHALLITGSNMSGKSTLLRAIGTNAVLALAGAPVCAERLEISPLQVLTSIQVHDSLEKGISHFYAEARRIKALLDGAAQAEGKAMFLLDEILLGTNTRERQVASREVLKLLLSTGAIGAVSTHDLALATLTEDSAFRVRNVHFRDSWANGRMHFDYRLRPGLLETGNALRVLREAGVPIPDDLG